MAGSADFKSDLAGSDLLDGRLGAKVIKIVDVSYGSENGFNQGESQEIELTNNIRKVLILNLFPLTAPAIELSAESLANVKFVQEKKLIQKYFDEIAQDTGKYCYGIDDTLKALELGAVETLIVFEGLDTLRYVLRSAAGEEHVIHSTPANKERDMEKFMDKATGLEMEQVQEPESLLEWFTENYKTWGCALEFVTDKSQEGNQYVKGFSGIGGILR